MISVCIATYNGEAFVLEQLQSILKQLGSDDEVIISDDHSNDRTLELIRGLNDSRITVMLNSLENGYTRNFENALLHSKGDIIFLADQDDVWADNKVQVVLQALESSDFVVSDAAITDGQLQVTFPSHFERNNTQQGFWTNFLKTRYIGACMAFRRPVLETALPFPKKQKYCAHDYWIAVVAERFYTVKLIHEPLVLYRRHGGNALNGGEKSTNSILKRLLTRIYVFGCLLGRKKAV